MCCAALDLQTMCCPEVHRNCILGVATCISFAPGHLVFAQVRAKQQRLRFPLRVSDVLGTKAEWPNLRALRAVCCCLQLLSAQTKHWTVP